MKIEVKVTQAYRLVNHGCLVLLTSAFKERINVMTLAWHMPVSSRPPYIAVGVAEGHFTHELIQKSEEFTLNIPNREMLSQVHGCGKVSGRKEDKFKKYQLTPAAAKKIRPPLIAECIGHIECGVVNAYRAGDHTIFVGEVIAAAAEEELFDGYWKEDPRAQTIHHLGGNFYLFSGERTEFKG